jgi:hypothetical protein
MALGLKALTPSRMTDTALTKLLAATPPPTAVTPKLAELLMGASRELLMYLIAAKLIRWAAGCQQRPKILVADIERVINRKLMVDDFVRAWQQSEQRRRTNAAHYQTRKTRITINREGDQ